MPKQHNNAFIDVVPHIIRFTNCHVAQNSALSRRDLWIDSTSGKIIAPQTAFWHHYPRPAETIDLQGKIISPGFIELQLNGYAGFDFSVPCHDYADRLKQTNRQLIKGGVTSYLATVTSAKPEVYHEVLPHLGADGPARDPALGAEVLGAHLEGPFISPKRNGIHKLDVLREGHTIQDITNMYGADNMPTISILTAAPELGKMNDLIPALVANDIVVSIGHSDASLSEARSAQAQGATMVTHMFNGMAPFQHRAPGIFGLLGQQPRESRPHFGLISDGIHLDPTAVALAYAAHPDGCVLVSDALYLAGKPDGVYQGWNGDEYRKESAVVRHTENGRLAGSAATLLECLNNMRKWTGASVAEALACVTTHPAVALGGETEKGKGGFGYGMDADLCVLEEGEDGDLEIGQVWKFGKKVCDASEEAAIERWPEDELERLRTEVEGNY